MSQPETSYYEIALTNRQIVTVFVVLLGCVVVAFLAGVWVGRGGGEPPIEAVEAGVVPAGNGERPLEHLQIFSGDGELPPAEDLAAPAAEPPAGAAAASRRGRPTETAVPTGEATARPEATAPEPAAAEPEPPPPAQQRPAPAAKAAAAPATGSETAPPPAAEAPPAPAESGLVVQVFSSKDLQQAERIVDRLRAAGYPALLAPVDVRGESMYRVRVGPYAERAEAQEVADRVRRQFRLETWITE